jgi:hypothetical protein
MKDLSGNQPFALKGIEKILIIRMNLMDEGNLLAFCNAR